jgi:hypothetical protein
MSEDLNVHFTKAILEPYKEYVRIRKAITEGLSQDISRSVILATSLFQFRDYFSPSQQRTEEELSQICPDYALLGEVVRAAQQFEKTGGSLPPASAREIHKEIRMSLYSGQQGEYWGYEREVVMDMPDGSTRDLYEIMTHVLNMWIDELKSLGIETEAPFPVEKTGTVEA